MTDSLVFGALGAVLFLAGTCVFAWREVVRARRQIRRLQEQVERLERERVPIALINESTRDEFSRAYPELAAYLSGRYFTVGRFSTRDQSRIAVAVREGFVASGSFGTEGWPCGLTFLDGQAQR